MQRAIIGLVGQIGAGKQEVASYLKTRGFLYFSLSSAVRDEAKRQELKFTRKNLQDVGDRLRKKFGLDVLAKRIWRKIAKRKPKKVVIDSIRNPAEVEFLRRKNKFFLVGVKAKRKVRFERIILTPTRDGDSGAEEWKEFLKADRRDWGRKQKRHGQQVGKVIRMADFVIHNDKGPKELYEQIEKVLDKIFRVKK